MTEFEQYSREAESKWGKSREYAQYQQKTKNYSQDKWQAVNDGLMAIMEKFANCMGNGNTPGSNEAQALVTQLQNYITDNYYTCTNQILLGLGQMYVADERFKNNIDKYNSGTAEFICSAIAIHCK